MGDLNGQTILHYKIIEQIGQGGMGTVYKAQDTKLDRFVALKFLPSQITSTQEEKARFVQEAKAASAMNHPNVCTIYDIQENEGQMFIVMEFIDGVTLRNSKQNLTEKRILDIGVQAAEGLAAAHEKGIVHRDIKPENIMIRKDGIVQIMDFGLAKLYSSDNVSRLTKVGTTMGTLGYMSPEQVQGLDVDHRTDIFSLGVVLYELLAGESPFKGVHETAIMYEIVNVDPPPISSIKEGIDPQLEGIILECIEKDKDERTQSAKELAKNLRKFQRVSTTSRASKTYNANTQSFNSKTAQTKSVKLTESSPAESSHSKNKISGLFNNTKALWILSGTFLLAIIFLLYLNFINGNKKLPTIRSYILPPDRNVFDNQQGGHIAISPNGLYIAFVATDSTNKDLLWIRPINSLTSIPLRGTEGASYPFWSTDSKFIGFFVPGKLKKIDVNGGPPLDICDAADGRGGTWNKEGIIVFSPTSAGGLSKVKAGGGTPEQIITPDSTNKQQSLRWPCFLPDGNHFLYSIENTATGSSNNDAVYLGSLKDDKLKKIIFHGSTNVQYSSGYLFYVRQSTLLAQKFDLGSFELKDDPIPIISGIQFYDARIKGIFSISRTGSLIYQGGNTQKLRLVFFNRQGDIISDYNDIDPVYGITFSPDGTRIAYDGYDAQSRNYDVWLYDLARHVSTRFTFNNAVDIAPLWSSDGNYIYFASNRNKKFEIFRKNVNGSGSGELVLSEDKDIYPTDVTRDGKYLTFSQDNTSGTMWDLWILPLTGNQKPFPVQKTKYNEWAGSFSPNSKWIAYQSDESGIYEIYVKAINGQEGKWQVSRQGGTTAVWNPNGKEILYYNNNKLYSTEIIDKGDMLDIGSTQQIIDGSTRGTASFYGISPDGSKYAFNVKTDSKNNVPITLVVNLKDELNKK